MTVLILIAGLAVAQEDLAEQIAPNDPSGCGLTGGMNPIGGTSGLFNARDALSVNAETYSAAAFAERNLFEDLARGKNDNRNKAFSASVEMNTTYNAARIPVYVPTAVSDPEECPANLEIALGQLDLASQNVGFAYRSGDFGVFYSSSLTYGGIAGANNFFRGLFWSLAVPMYTTVAAVFAPALGGYRAQSGAGSLQVDWIGGFVYDGPIKIRGGYAGSTGLYLNAKEPYTAAFVSTTVRPTDNPLDNIKVGIRRFDLRRFGAEKAGDAVGMTSGYYRELPFGLQQVVTGLADQNRPFVSRLKTGHVAQEDIGGVLDLRLAYAFAPTAVLNEALIGVHNPGFVKRPDTGVDEPAAGASVAAGVVTLPTDYGLGVEGGRYTSVRVQGGGSGFSEDLPLGFLMDFKYNDAETLALYPFSRNAFSYSIVIRGDL